MTSTTVLTPVVTGVFAVFVALIGVWAQRQARSPIVRLNGASDDQTIEAMRVRLAAAEVKAEGAQARAEYAAGQVVAYKEAMLIAQKDVERCQRKAEECERREAELRALLKQKGVL